MTLTVTLAVLAGFVLLLAISAYIDRRPPELGKIRLIPYRGLMVLSVIAIIALIAHLVTLLTGVPLQGRNKPF